jgi:hypothetical protein
METSANIIEFKLEFKDEKLKTDNKTEKEKRRKGLTRLTWPPQPTTTAKQVTTKAAQPSPYTSSLDKTEEELTVFFFACVDARQLATAMERPRPVVVAAVADHQHTRETV